MRKHRKLLALLLAFELIAVQLFTMQSEWTSISARADEIELIDETNLVSTVNPISTLSPTNTASSTSPVSPTNTVNPTSALTPTGEVAPSPSPAQMTSDNNDEPSETTPTPDTQETPLPEKTSDPIKGMPEPTETLEPTDENETTINPLVISPNAQFIDGTEGNDTLNGTNNDDIINGYGGNDTIYGNNGNDLIQGGAGNDTLYGGYGNDTYLFGVGYGNDIISDSSENNILKFTGNITIADFKTERSGSYDLVLINKITGERTTISYFYYNPSYRDYTLTFDDGSEEHILGDNSPLWTIYGTAENDNLSSWSLGTHTIKIYGLAGNDTLTGTDYPDELYGGAGNDVIQGSNGNDLIVGGEGNDTLYGGYGNDTYLFGAGYGNDIISDSTENNILKFAGDITIADFKTERSGSYDLVLINKITGERTTISYFYYNPSYRDYTLTFDDGSEEHILGDNSPLWTIYGTAENDNISSWSLGTHTIKIYGLAGNDAINGSSYGDELYGGDDNDTINANSGNDLIQGGAGNDTLYGGYGDDTYLFDAGYGNDTVVDYYGNNTLKFTGGITIADFKTERDGSHLILINKVTYERTTIYYFYYDASYRNYTLKFDNGSTYHILGENSPLWTIYGTAGNDTLTAWSLGTHKIKIYGLAGNDTINGSSYDDELYGEDGNDTINANNGNDLIQGGSGNDNLYGGYGDDTYTLWAGSGNDIISDCYENNVIRFTGATTPSNLTLEKSGSDLKITNSTSGEITILQNYVGSSAYRNYVVEFADFSVYNIVQSTENPNTYYLTPAQPIADANEPNNTFDTATAVSLSATINGSISVPSDIDYFTITVNEGGAYEITATLSNIPYGRNYELEIYQKCANKYYKISESKNTGSISEKCNKYIQSGTYYIKVYSAVGYSSANYTLNISSTNVANVSMPLSGYERAYEPNKWNTGEGRYIQDNANCYAYALNLIRHPITGEIFPLTEQFNYLQVGQFYNINSDYRPALNDTTGKELINLCIGDASAIGGVFKPIKRDEVCPAGTYKVALVMNPGIGWSADYHWYRQNPDGTWSHKLGKTKVTNIDKSENIITDPLTANRENSLIFVGYFAVKPILSGAPE